MVPTMMIVMLMMLMLLLLVMILMTIYDDQYDLNIRKKYNMLARAITKIGQDGGDDDDDGCDGNDCYLQPRWR